MKGFKKNLWPLVVLVVLSFTWLTMFQIHKEWDLQAKNTLAGSLSASPATSAQTIKIAAPTPVSLMSEPKATVSTPRKYLVISGDTLTKIAKREGVTIAAIATANKITNLNVIRAERWIVIPPVTSATAVTLPTFYDIPSTSVSKRSLATKVAKRTVSMTHALNQKPAFSQTDDPPRTPEQKPFLITITGGRVVTTKVVSELQPEVKKKGEITQTQLTYVSITRSDGVFILGNQSGRP